MDDILERGCLGQIRFKYPCNKVYQTLESVANSMYLLKKVIKRPSPLPPFQS